MARVSRAARTVHRVLSYVVFAQLTVWILGGLTFAVIPFGSIIKSESVMDVQPPTAFPAQWWKAVAPHIAAAGDVDGLATFESSQGPLLELRSGEERRWIRLTDGSTALVPEAAEVSAYAQQLYAGDGAVTETRYIDESEYRVLGLVDELYGRTGLWQVNFDDTLGTRLYFDGETGRYLTVRNDFWVFYDAMWRLHIMDYSGGEDFNNALLRIFTPLAMLFALAGLVLTWTAARRSLKRRAGRATSAGV